MSDTTFGVVIACFCVGAAGLLLLIGVELGQRFHSNPRALAECRAIHAAHMSEQHPALPNIWETLEGEKP